MTKRIFHSICFVALGVFLACITLFMCILYEYFSSVQEKQLRDCSHKGKYDKLKAWN